MTRALLNLCTFAVTVLAIAAPVQAQSDRPGFQKLPGNTYVRDYSAETGRNMNDYTRLPGGNTYVRNDDGQARRGIRFNDDNSVVIYSGAGGGYNRGYGYGNPAPVNTMNAACTGASDRREYKRCMKDAAEAQEDLYDKYN